MDASFNATIFFDTLFSPLVARAAWTTLWVATVAQAIGTLLGVILAPALVWRSRPFDLLVGAYLWLFRGTPLLAQILFLYAALPQMGLRLGVVATGLLALGLNEGARMTEVMRGGLLSVPREQREAATALGLRPIAVFRLVILPQAMRAILPPLASNYTYMIKATSLLSVISFTELLRTAQLVAQSTATPLETYAAVAVVYLAIVSVVTAGQHVLERRLARPERPPPRVARAAGAVAASPMQAGDGQLVAQGISRRHGGFVALHPTSLAIQRGEVVAVLGPSGSGKSTLLRCLNWLDPPDEGVVLLDGQPVGAVPLPGGGRVKLAARQQAAMRVRFGMVFQRFHLFPHLTALGNVALGPRRVRGIGRDAALAEAQAQLERFDLGELAHRYPATLSGGQRQRVAIARALAMQPAILLLDEPTSALDPEAAQEVLASIRSLAGTGVTMLIATHELSFARAVAHRVLLMQDGRLAADMPATRFFASEGETAASGADFR